MSIQFVKRCEKDYRKITFFCQIKDFLKESPVKTENFGVATHRKYNFILRFFLKYDILDKKRHRKEKSMSVQIKLLSSLEKCFTDEALAQKPALSHASCLRGEDFHFTLAYAACDIPAWRLCEYGTLVCESELDISFERIEHVPVRIPCYPSRNDENYLRKKPGLYPDMLVPMEAGETIQISSSLLLSIYGTVKVPEATKAGEYTVSVGFTLENGETITEKFTLRVIDAVLPAQEISVTQWVHYDCIADAHGLEIFSEEHWQAIENYLKTATAHCINNWQVNTTCQFCISVVLPTAPEKNDIDYASINS
jgi:hypothetical protein